MRARNIKPKLFSDEVLAERSPLARLLLIGLWCQADREGRLEYRPRRIKAQALPYDDVDVETLIQELSPEYLRIYEANGQRYIQIANFGRDQNPHPNESPSEIPKPPEPSRRIANGSDPSLFNASEREPKPDAPVTSVQVSENTGRIAPKSLAVSEPAQGLASASVSLASVPKVIGLIPDTGSLISDSGLLTPNARAATAATSDWSMPDLSEQAAELVGRLMQSHPTPGNVSMAKAAAERVLGKMRGGAEAIARSHGQWLTYWREMASRGERVFIPQLWRWLQDEDYVHPPNLSGLKAEAPGSKFQRALKEASNG